MALYNIAQDCLDRHADKIALIFVDESNRVTRWTFAKLSLGAGRVARWLRGQGIRRGNRVVIQLPNGPEFVLAFLGAVKAGAIPIPASFLLTPREVDLIVRDSGARLTLKDPSAVIKASRTGLPLTRISSTKAGDPAYWLYTSGTEGCPKGVIHAHRSIPAHDVRSRVWLGLRKNDVVFNTSSLNWSYALTAGLLDVWRFGATSLVVRGDLEPERLLRILEEQKVTIFMSVPGIYRRLVEYGGKRLKLRAALSAGEKLPPEVRRKFLKQTGLTIREGLGMTEHSVYLVQPKEHRVVEGSCGRALPGHRIAILRGDLKPARTGEVGILSSHRSCPGLMLGYHRRGSAFRNGWFLSGDLARRDVRGNFFYVGRGDDVMTAGGYRISPLEIEGVLNHHSIVAESAAVGEEIEPGKTIVAAYVVLKKRTSGPEKARKALLRFAGGRLARYKQPRKIYLVDALPKTSTGKILRKSLRERAGIR